MHPCICICIGRFKPSSPPLAYSTNSPECTLAVQAAASDDDDEDGPYSAADLEGMKVKTDVGELGDGDTIIVTLADKAILDERGNLRDEDDELEDVLAAQQKKRDVARKAAGKAKPLWEEDGKVGGPPHRTAPHVVAAACGGENHGK